MLLANCCAGGVLVTCGGLCWACMHADALGTVGLLFCLAAGSGYQQPPLRSVRREAAKDQEPLLLKKDNRKENIV